MKKLMERKARWERAHKQFLCRAGSPQFLMGTFLDRQTGAQRTHRWRKALGVHSRARKDHAGLHTRTHDGHSRWSLFTSDRNEMLARFVEIAHTVRAGAYEPNLLTGARWDKLGRDSATLLGQGIEPKWRMIYYPSEPDKVVGVVLLEIIEPIIDHILSIYQHGYRATKVNGRHHSIPGFKSPRGSTDIVVERMKRMVGRGATLYCYQDVVSAFDNVCRELLHAMLLDDGCPIAFADQIIRLLGRAAHAHWLTDGSHPKAIANVELAGIPLGSPVGPLLFNFFIRSVHLPITRNSLMAGFADDLFHTSRCSSELTDRLGEVDQRLGALRLLATVDHPVDLTDGKVRTVLGEWEIHIPSGGKKLKVRKVCRKDRSQPPSPSLGPGPTRVASGLDSDVEDVGDALVQGGGDPFVGRGVQSAPSRASVGTGRVGGDVDLRAVIQEVT